MKNLSEVKYIIPFYRAKNSVPALEPIPVVDVKFSLKDRIKRLLRGKS